MLSNLNDQLAAIFERDVDRIVDLRQSALRKLDIQNGTDNLCNLTYIFICHLLFSLYLIMLSAKTAAGSFMHCMLAITAAVFIVGWLSTPL